MGEFVTAYLVVWLAAVLYLARLDARQRRLAQAVETLRSQFEQSDRPNEPRSAAA
jgi:CcmD family protein